MPSKWWNSDRIEQLISLAHSGYKTSEIASVMGKTEQAVAVKASLLGVPLGRVTVPKSLKTDPMALRLYAWEHKVLPVVSISAAGCHVWSGSNYRGYGRLCIGGKILRLHRLALEVKLGRLLVGGEHACHSCDNPACVNPDHVFLGDHLSNMKDKAVKGRASRLHGTRCHLSKLTDDTVLKIRIEFDGSRGAIARLSRKYGVGETTVGEIVKRRTWKHI